MRYKPRNGHRREHRAANALQAVELRNAIYAVAGAADQLDDELIDEVGGKTYEMVLDEASFTDPGPLEDGD